VSSYRLIIIVAIAFVLCATTSTPAQVGDYEGRTVTAVEVVIEGSPPDESTQAELQSRLAITANHEYSAVRTRQSLKALFDSDRVESARVEITEVQPGAGKTSPISVRFIVRRQVLISEVKLVVGPTTGPPISTDELRARLN
jgi:hypothetical protein